MPLTSVTGAPRKTKSRCQNLYLERELTRPSVSSLPAPGMAPSLQSLPLNPLSAGVPGGSDNLKELSKCSNWIKRVPFLFFLPSGATTCAVCKPRPVACVLLSLVCGPFHRRFSTEKGLQGFLALSLPTRTRRSSALQPGSQTSSASPAFHMLRRYFCLCHSWAKLCVHACVLGCLLFSSSPLRSCPAEGPGGH